MVLWMAVRIHYRPGLLHSSKRIDKKRKKNNLWTCIQNHSNNGTKKKSFRTAHEFLICHVFFSPS